MRDSNKRALVAPLVRANLANPTDTGATKCLSRRMVLGLTLLAAAIAVPAMAFAVPQATTSSQSLKCIQYLIDRGQVDDAEKQLWEIITREPENVPAINLLGAIRTWQKRYPEAEALFKRVLAIQPDFVSANRSLGQLYALQGRRDDAKAAYQTALELEPRDAKTALALGTLYEETNEFTRPIETINTIPANWRPPAALPVLASDYFTLNRPDKLLPLTPRLPRGADADASVCR